MIDQVTEIQKELSRIACPQCNKSNFDLVLQCQVGYEECQYDARCLACHHTFAVTTESKNLANKHPNLEKELKSLRCEKCRHQGARLSFRCDLKENSCLYVAICEKCGHPSHEYR
ncbi:MAG: hypothetical protein HY200_09095 [Nitrospirae bacterium]|nr:hypothetical protein [Nitrospirota bacterium]